MYVFRTSLHGQTSLLRDAEENHNQSKMQGISRLTQAFPAHPDDFALHSHLSLSVIFGNAHHMATETTLILFKPDCVQKNLSGSVLDRFQKEGLTIRGIKMMTLSDELLAEHYAHVADKPFFPEIVAFMQKTPVIALALEGEDAIGRVRDLLGPTNSKEAPAGTIRGDLGEDMMTNVCHASDGPETAAAELKRFFNEGEIFSY
ncbi:nucleoside diphosphate kinase [Rubritalea halochordaticola]|uniref:Nucleoside diphosphate kinase n=2 Tax=Rubritalea halochordaticola TaxID=714537 RepID=A0ABP9V3T7_9BACT